MCVLDHGMEEKNMAFKSSRKENERQFRQIVKLELLANWLQTSTSTECFAVLNNDEAQVDCQEVPDVTKKPRE